MYDVFHCFLSCSVFPYQKNGQIILLIYFISILLLHHYRSGKCSLTANVVLHESNNYLTQMLHPQHIKSDMTFILKNQTRFNNYTLQLNLMLYCNEKPKFSLRRGVLITFLLRLELCQLVTGHSWFDEECAKPFYNLTDYHKMSYDKVCNPTKYALQCNITE